MRIFNLAAGYKMSWIENEILNEFVFHSLKNDLKL